MKIAAAFRAAFPLAALLALLSSAHADMADDCVHAADPLLRVGGCTAAIDSGRWSGPNLAWAYNNRGIAYRALALPTHAIQDLDHAIHLDPENATAYNHRGDAYEELGDFDAAVRDWERAMVLAGPEWVQFVQEHLRARGHYAGPIDGAYGPGTRAALEACAADPLC